MIIGLYLFYRINRRIKKLQTNVAGFINSDFSKDQSEEFNPGKQVLGDEITELERHISKMSAHIKQQWSALKQQDNLRREMVANISHDLRTPLASIQGYLETLAIKEKNLSAESQGYLATALQNSKELERRVDNLLELSRLESLRSPVGQWTRTMWVSEDEGASWRVLWSDHLARKKSP